MVDNMNDESQMIPPSGPKPKSPIVQFLSSSTGRLIVGGILLFVIVVIAGAFTFFFLLNGGNQGATVVVTPPPSGGSKPASESVAPTNPPEEELNDTFTFRNIFAPTVHPASASSTSGSTSGSTETSGSTVTSGSVNVPPDTLILKSITTENGERVATFYWNGAVYSVHAGDQVDDSPWKVLTIYSDSVLMLYGDSQVTLTVGQGFTKSTTPSISK